MVRRRLTALGVIDRALSGAATNQLHYEKEAMTEDQQEEMEEEGCGHCFGCVMNRLMGTIADRNAVQGEQVVIYEDDDFRVLEIKLPGNSDTPPPPPEVIQHIVADLLSLLRPPSDEGGGMLIEDLLDQSTLDFVKKQQAKIKR